MSKSFNTLAGIPAMFLPEAEPEPYPIALFETLVRQTIKGQPDFESIRLCMDRVQNALSCMVGQRLIAEMPPVLLAATHNGRVSMAVGKKNVDTLADAVSCYPNDYMCFAEFYP